MSHGGVSSTAAGDRNKAGVTRRDLFLGVLHQQRLAAEAIRSIGRVKPDAVILDARLSDGNSMEVLAELKKSDPAPFVIIFAHRACPEYRKRFMEAGADYFLEKSKEFEKLPGLLQHLAEVGEPDPERSRESVPQ